MTAVEKISLPAFAIRSIQPGGWKIQLRPQITKDRKWTAIGVIFLLPVFVALGPLLASPALPQSTWLAISCVATAGAIGSLIYPVIVLTTHLLIRHRVSFDGVAIQFGGTKVTTTIPVDQIRSVSVEQGPNRYVDVDISRPPGRLFKRINEFSLVITTDDARIHVFPNTKVEHVEWVAGTLSEIFGFPASHPSDGLPLIKASALSHDQGGDPLFDKYVAIGTSTRADPTAVHEWYVPQTTWDAERKIQSRQLLNRAFKVWFVVVILTLAICWEFRSVVPAGFKWWELVLVFAMLPAYQLLQLFSIPRQPPTYRIGSDGLILRSRQPQLVRWNRFEQAAVRRHEARDDARVLVLKSCQGHQIRVPVPNGPESDSIVELVTSRIPPPAGTSDLQLSGLGPVGPRPTPSSFAIGSLLVVLALYLVFVGSILSDRIGPLQHKGGEVLLIGMLANPATIWALVLWRRFNRIGLVVFTIYANFFTTVGFLIMTSIRQLNS